MIYADGRRQVVSGRHCPKLLSPNQGTVNSSGGKAGFDSNLIVMEERGRKIAALKQEISVLRARKEWHLACISSGTLSDRELLDKQQILNKIMAALEQVSKELLEIGQGRES